MSDILDEYKKMVEFLGRVMGEDSEIVLQDCRKKDGKVIAIANGHVSGRKAGAPLTDYALKIISDGEWRTKDWEVNYTGRTKGAKMLRSSTYFIKDKGELIGMLCINVDVSTYERISEELLHLGGVHLLKHCGEGRGAQVVERFADSIPEMIGLACEEVFGSNSGFRPDRLNQEERMLVIRNLDQKGMFLLKGAVSEAAVCFGCSEASMYRYLSKLSKLKSSEEENICRK